MSGLGPGISKTSIVLPQATWSELAEFNLEPMAADRHVSKYITGKWESARQRDRKTERKEQNSS